MKLWNMIHILYSKSRIIASKILLNYTRFEFFNPLYNICLPLLFQYVKSCSIKSHFKAKSITFDRNGFPTFDVYLNGNFYSTIKLSVAGIHNVSNAIACIAI